MFIPFLVLAALMVVIEPATAGECSLVTRR
jgi:hypothetical protein